LRPKLVGGLLLHELVGSRDLDFFLSYSSGAGIWGGAGQAHYGAANHALDGLSAWRRQQGLPSLSIAWGPIAGTEMVSASDTAPLSAMGVQVLEPEQLLAVQASLLGGTAQQVTVAAIDWSRFRPLYTASRQRRLLDELADSVGVATPRHAAPSMRGALRFDRQEYAQLSPDEQQALLVDLLRQTLMRIGGFTAEQVPLTQNLLSVGLDSLMAVEWRLQIEELWGVQVPLSQLLVGDGLMTIAHSVMEQLAAQIDRMGRDSQRWLTTDPKVHAPALDAIWFYPDDDSTGNGDNDYIPEKGVI